MTRVRVAIVAGALVVTPAAGAQTPADDHGSFDYQTTAGLLLSSRAPTSSVTRIIDIAPTVLKFFGLAIPPDMDGKPLF